MKLVNILRLERSGVSLAGSIPVAGTHKALLCYTVNHEAM